MSASQFHLYLPSRFVLPQEHIKKKSQGKTSEGARCLKRNKCISVEFVCVLQLILLLLDALALEETNTRVHIAMSCFSALIEANIAAASCLKCFVKFYCMWGISSWQHGRGLISVKERV